MPGRLDRWLSRVHRLENAVLAVVLGSMVLLSSAQILLRNLFDWGFVWSDPVLRLLVLWVGLLGAMVASRRNNHITVDVMARLLPKRGKDAAQVVVNLFTAMVSGLVAWHAGRFVFLDYEAQVEGVAGLPAWVGESILPFAFGVICLRHLLLSARAATDRPATE